MPLQVTVEVIGGTKVVRFNGNNPGGHSLRGRVSVGEAGGPRLAKTRSAKITAWRKRKVKEMIYERRYLGA